MTSQISLFKRKNKSNQDGQPEISASMGNGGGAVSNTDNAGFKGGELDKGFTTKQALPALLDLQLALGMVLGGCCANVWTYEELLNLNPRIGSALTFSQMIFIALYHLSEFLRVPSNAILPRLKPRNIPLRQWAAQVILFAFGSLANNWVFAYNVPLSVMIVFRSAGLPVSLILGKLLMKKKYSPGQVTCVALVTLGVILASISRPSSANSASKIASPGQYSRGIALLVFSSFLTGILGVMQEKTYKKYGPHWQEGVFYTHTLSLPIFVFLVKDVAQGLSALSLAKGASWIPYGPYGFLALNLASQLVCVSGVNKLSSQVSSVSTNLVLTTRKALSLCFSVWWFQTGWNLTMVSGACMVFFGSFLFGFAAKQSEPRSTTADSDSVVVESRASQKPKQR